MKLHFAAYVALVALIGLAADSCGANELKGGAPVGPSTSASSASASVDRSYSTVSGVVTAIEAKRGTLVLDGQRRYAFVASTLSVRRQTDTRRPAGVADVRVGERVSLSVVTQGANPVAKVSEVWIAQ